MRDLFQKIEGWFTEGENIAIVTVVKTWGSSPNPIGSIMLITESGRFIGSVSGGCVEGAVIEKSKNVIKNKVPLLMHYGVTDEDAWEVGLACGGEIDVFIQPLSKNNYTRLIKAAENKKAPTYWTIIKGPDKLIGKIIFEKEELKKYNRESGIEIFKNFLTFPLEIVLIGGAQIAVKLSELANVLGCEVTIIDPRKAFIQEERFPASVKIIHGWPDEAFKDIQISKSSAIVTLSHDPKIDDPALLVALTSPAFYIGALGSMKTQKNLKERLVDAGLPKSSINRLKGPVGLDIGAKTPAEIALSILAEIIEVWRKDFDIE